MLGQKNHRINLLVIIFPVLFLGRYSAYVKRLQIYLVLFHVIILCCLFSICIISMRVGLVSVLFITLLSVPDSAQYIVDTQ